MLGSRFGDIAPLQVPHSQKQKLGIPKLCLDVVAHIVFISFYKEGILFLKIVKPLFQKKGFLHELKI